MYLVHPYPLPELLKLHPDKPNHDHEVGVFNLLIFARNDGQITLEGKPQFPDPPKSSQILQVNYTRVST